MGKALCLQVNVLVTFPSVKIKLCKSCNDCWFTVWGEFVHTYPVINLELLLFMPIKVSPVLFFLKMLNKDR